jgi:hypothetical protein
MGAHGASQKSRPQTFPKPGPIRMSSAIPIMPKARLWLGQGLRLDSVSLVVAGWRNCLPVFRLAPLE